jgi:hypothetical protein
MMSLNSGTKRSVGDASSLAPAAKKIGTAGALSRFLQLYQLIM